MPLKLNASRPHMPGYGLLSADQGTGLKPWSYAVERLSRSSERPARLLNARRGAGSAVVIVVQDHEVMARG